MSDLMFYGVLNMPYELAMADEISRLQFYGRVKEAVDRLQKAEADVANLVEACNRLLVCMKLANWEGDDAAIYARTAIAKATGQCLKGEE